MVETGYSTINATVDKTNRLLKEIEQAYGWSQERRHQSWAALRAVLHALRDRLPVEEAAQLGAQLPMLVRGMYYTGWDPSRVPVKMHKEEFHARVRREFPFEIEGGVESLIRTVLNALRLYIAEGEWEDVKSSIPGDLADEFP
ncbi:DUF2267 domain-containing protein [Microbispora hainanensis]|jgi:uncharacterized protein (DUF2267 family)|uniref:DUF2267 domain-containing protein n=1 Tax=Microbispora hainanensis TaxID=568844 RepID=A0ABZ1SWJ4_9ACTN|nr:MULTISPECIES: DUF2267 domain-containing protein [Microbispora]NJP24662.1 DUF2267 domain-containing protein [Microbispora sp. CL1-1]TQS14785.1 DUF2267 domain-containing protein [Microbispora sp. SCL1-1]